VTSKSSIREKLPSFWTLLSTRHLKNASLGTEAEERKNSVLAPFSEI